MYSFFSQFLQCFCKSSVPYPQCWYLLQHRKWKSMLYPDTIADSLIVLHRKSQSVHDFPHRACKHLWTCQIQDLQTDDSVVFPVSQNIQVQISLCIFQLHLPDPRFHLRILNCICIFPPIIFHKIGQIKQHAPG